MKVNGYKLQQSLRELQHRRELMATNFAKGLFQFEDQGSMTPTKCYLQFQACEEKIAKIQVLQTRYNLEIEVVVLTETMPLSEAVKRIGGAGRGEKMWRSAAKDDGKDRYSTGIRDMERSKDTEYAQRAISIEECVNHAQTAARFASALREAVQLGNSKEMDIPDEHASLFE